MLVPHGKARASIVAWVRTELYRLLLAGTLSLVRNYAICSPGRLALRLGCEAGLATLPRRRDVDVGLGSRELLLSSQGEVSCTDLDEGDGSHHR
jgi:hypothetical protein